MPTVQQLPLAVAVNLTDEVMIDQGGTSVAATVAQVLEAEPLGTGLTRNGTTLEADVTVLAPLASPALTGTPTVPTPPAGDNSTRIATTAFVLSNGTTLTGDVTGTGTGTIDTTLAAVVTPGTYEKVTVDAKGRVTSGSVLAASDIADALGFAPIAGNQSITLSGDASGSGTTAISVTLPAVITPGSYEKVTVDAKGRVIAGGALAAADLAGALAASDLSASDVTASGASTARTLAARAGDVVNVLDYGADPTGTNDSAGAFTAAMDAVPSGAWGRVFVPHGSYRLASVVNQPAGRSVAVTFDDGANISGPGYLGVDRVESAQGPYRSRVNAGGWFGFAPGFGDATNPAFEADYLFNTPQNSLSMRVGWDRRYTNSLIYGKAHSGIDIAEQRIHSWPNLYDNSSGWGLWEVLNGPTLDEDTAARAGLSCSAELSETDIVNNAAEAGWTWHSGVGNTVQGMSIDPWGQNGLYGGGILYSYGAVGSFDGSAGGLNARWFSYPAVFSTGNVVAGAGTLIVNGTTINVSAGESLAGIAAAINAAAIADVRAAVNTWGAIVSRLVIYSTQANDQGTLTLAGTALGPLGIAPGTFTTPRGAYAAVIGDAGPAAVGDQLVVNGATVTVGGSGAAADVAAAINAAAVPGVAADTNAAGNLVITCYMAVQPGGLVLTNAPGDTTLGKLGIAAGTYLPPTPPKAFATAYSDVTSPVCLTTDQISITATDAAGTAYGPVAVTLTGGSGTGWPQDVATSISTALAGAGFLSSDFTALSSGSAVVAVRATGSGATQGVQIRNTAGGTLTLADAHGAPLETLGIAAGTYQPGGYSAASQTVFMAAEDSIAPGGRGVFVGGVSNATDLTVFPHTPFEARGGFLHGLRLDQATFNDNNAIVLAPAQGIAWGNKAQGQHVLSVAAGTLEFDGAPMVNPVALDAAFSSAVGALLVRGTGGWAALAPGTAGQVLEANGTASAPAWTTPAADNDQWTAGTVSALGPSLSIASGTLDVAFPAPEWSGGTVTAVGGVLTLSAGTLEIGAVGPNSLLANASGGTAAPTGVALSSLLDSALGNNQGVVAYRSATGWVALPPGAAGDVLQSNGTGNALTWTTPAALVTTLMQGLGTTVPASTGTLWNNGGLLALS